MTGTIQFKTQHHSLIYLYLGAIGTYPGDTTGYYGGIYLSIFCF